MSLNDIRLTASLIADLYPDVLIEQLGQKRVQRPVNFLGRNEKNILIVSNEKDAVYLTEQQLAFLMAILEACRLGLADVDRVYVDQDGDWRQGRVGPRASDPRERQGECRDDP